ncbi:hypothetical protein VTK56DRAFT_443 [Thermocarpiscus australiensis]
MPPPSFAALGATTAEHPVPHQFASAVGSSLRPAAVRKRPSAGTLITSTTAAGKTTARIITAGTATPEAATAPVSRHPLRPRDENATLGLRAAEPGPETKSHPSTAARMPSYERASVPGSRQPTAARVVNKPPLTPKIAARPTTSQHQTPTLATPLARRPAPESCLAVNGTSSRDRNDLTPPLSAFLSSNITPRSGSRQSRVDSANSTPNGTPRNGQQDHWEARSGLGDAGSSTDDAHKRPVVTLSPASDAGGGPRLDRDSKFFYASDAQKQPQQAPNTIQVATQQQKSATFFYANGGTVLERQATGPAPAAASPPGHDNLMSKFVYANGAPELQPPAKIGPSSQAAPSSVASTSSRIPASGRGNGPRPVSPVKSPQQLTARNGSSSTTVSPRSSVSMANFQSSSQALSQGKVNSESQGKTTKPHARTASGTIVEAPSIANRMSAQSPGPSSGRASPSNPSQTGVCVLPSSPAALGFASLLQAAEDVADSNEAKPESSLNSPTKTPQDSQLTELVASARRERKVQDLEITNASLEAINRTLERQLRKQTAELRRYQRLSRSGRLSLGPVGSRIPSDSTVDGGALARAGMNLDDLSEEESEIEAEDAELEKLEEAEENDLSGSEASEESSPGADSRRGASRRKRDERRLQLDLSKHQQLLIDSQKINQSLKRCLGWTEELIKEGKRALAYQVRVSDVQLGGRVLAPDEVEGREADADGDGSEENDHQEDTMYGTESLLGEGSVAEAETNPWSKQPQDRDSGIELPADGG